MEMLLSSQNENLLLNMHVCPNRYIIHTHVHDIIV